MKLSAMIFCALICVSSFAGAVPTSQQAKLWASDLPAFMNQNPQHNWIVGISAQPELSANDAEAAAEADAAKQLAARLEPQQLSRRGDREAFERRIAASLKQNDWIVDRQIQSTVRPYATLWHSAILVEVVPDKLERLQGQLRSELAHEHDRVISAGIAGAAWFAVIAFAYLTLNWLTRGFFRGRLIFISLLLVVVGVVGMMQLF